MNNCKTRICMMQYSIGDQFNLLHKVYPWKTPTLTLAIDHTWVHEQKQIPWLSNSKSTGHFPSKGHTIKRQCSLLLSHHFHRSSPTQTYIFHPDLMLLVMWPMMWCFPIHWPDLASLQWLAQCSRPNWGDWQPSGVENLEMGSYIVPNLEILLEFLTNDK